MMARLRRFATAAGGGTAVEFALVVGPLVLLMFGLVEGGRYLWTRQALYSAANEGARCMGVVQLACADGGAYSSDRVTEFVIGKAAGMRVDITAADVTLDHDATCAGIAGFSRVDIRTEFVTALPMLGGLSDGVPLSAWACFPNQA